jgi:hypothetical protein
MDRHKKDKPISCRDGADWFDARVVRSHYQDTRDMESYISYAIPIIQYSQTGRAVSPLPTLGSGKFISIGDDSDNSDGRHRRIFQGSCHHLVLPNTDHPGQRPSLIGALLSTY